MKILTSSIFLALILVVLGTQTSTAQVQIKNRQLHKQLLGKYDANSNRTLEVTELNQLDKLDYRSMGRARAEYFDQVNFIHGLVLNAKQLDTSVHLFQKMLNLSELEIHDIDQVQLQRVQVLIKGQPQLKKIRLTGATQESDWLATLGSYHQLEELSLSGFKMDALPSSWSNLKSLKSFSLKRSALKSLKNVIGNWPELETLILHDIEVGKLPGEIGRLKKLNKLSIYKSALTSLPNEIAKCQNLVSLKVTLSKLSKFPDQVYKLNKLEELDLGAQGNKFQYSKKIAKLTKLKKLPFTLRDGVPDYIFKMKGLEELDLSGQQLTEVPKGLANLTQLKKLSLRNNSIVTLPETFAKLNRLENLDLSKNQLTELPSGFRALSELIELRLNENALSVVPEALAKLSKLKRLELSQNKVADWTLMQGDFSELSHIDLNENPIAELPNEIMLLSKLTSLNLENTGVEVLPASICYLRTSVTLSSGERKRIDDHCYEKLPLDYSQHIGNNYKERTSCTEAWTDPSCEQELFVVQVDTALAAVPQLIGEVLLSTMTKAPTFVVIPKCKAYIHDTILLRGRVDSSYTRPYLLIDSEPLLISTGNDELPLSQKPKLSSKECYRVLTKLEEYRDSKYTGKATFMMGGQLFASGAFVEGLPSGHWQHYFYGAHEGEFLKSDFSISEGQLHGDYHTYRARQSRWKMRGLEEHKEMEHLPSISSTYRNGKRTKLTSRARYSNVIHQDSLGGTYIYKPSKNDQPPRVEKFQFTDLQRQDHNKDIEEIYDWRSARNNIQTPLINPTDHPHVRALDSYYHGKYYCRDGGMAERATGNYYYGTKIGTWHLLNHAGDTLSTEAFPELAAGPIQKIDMFIPMDKKKLLPERRLTGQRINDVKQGEWIEYDKSGNVASKGSYVDDKVEGEFLHYKNKDLVLRTNYKQGQLNGLADELEEGRVVRSTEYADNLKQGLRLSTYELTKNKYKVIVTNYHLDKRNGRQLTYIFTEPIDLSEWAVIPEQTKKVNLRREESFKDDYLHGPFVSYFHPEIKAKEGAYIAGVKDGEWYSYNEDGSYRLEVHEAIFDAVYGWQTDRLSRVEYDKDGKLKK